MVKEFAFLVSGDTFGDSNESGYFLSRWKGDELMAKKKATKRKLPKLRKPIKTPGQVKKAIGR